MCGIVGAVAERQIADILIEGLRRLEYRGYDSAGLAVIDREHAVCFFFLTHYIHKIRTKISRRKETIKLKDINKLCT